MEKLNILLALNRFYPEVGGAETNLYFQASKLARKFNVTVFTPKRIESNASEVLNGFRVFRFFDLLNPRGKLPNLKSKTLSPGMFFKVLFSKDIDVIMCFPAVSYNTILVFTAAKIRRIPIILCSFDMLDYGAILEREGRIDPNILRTYNFSFKSVFFFRRFDKIFAISNREIEVLRRYNNDVVYSPVPVLIEEYEKAHDNPRKKHKIESSDFVFLSLGRITSIKGQDIALDSFISISDMFPESKMVFVGRDDYEAEFVKGMKDKVKMHGLESRVVFTGSVTRNEVIGWLQHSNIHIVPVRFMNSGAVIVETWAAGTSVIQSDSVDPNLIEEGINGYLFKNEDRNDLAEKMKKAIQEKSELANMARRGNAMVREKYTYDSLIELYSSAFEKMLPAERAQT